MTSDELSNEARQAVLLGNDPRSPGVHFWLSVLSVEGQISMLAVGAIERVPSPDPNISNRCATAWARFAGLLKNIAAVDGLSLDAE